ncbi:negative acting factor [Colletotrichum musicola]|uniref:Negative acting factor n=1 Tax=Colletotrichum musicola TaxID=2175873 RepID=A0A8H6N8D3_9PEZI|nr:negative acting factor [Colletotrichum musicola]
MAQEDNPSISTSTGLSTSASTSASVPASTPAPAPVPTSMPTSADTPTPTPTPAVTATPVPVVPVTDAGDAAPPPPAPLTSTASTNSVPPPTSSTSPPPPPPSATPTLTSTPTPTPTAEPLSIATANANANASTPLLVAATSTAPATTNATAPAPAAAPALPPQQNDDARVPSSGMANQPPPGPPRNYPSPNNFSSPALPTGQYATYHAQPSQPPADHYRASPGAPVPSLPSMKSLPDPHFQQGAPQHQHQHQHAHQHQHQHPHQHQHQHQPMPMQMSMPPNPAAMSYYMNPAVQNPYMQDLSAMRYPIAPGPHDPRLMRGPGGPKKCDEAHPTCNNCKKSKRECLGYDPIFKQQPGPSAIQPAPNAPRVPTPTVPSLPSSSVPPAVPTVPSTPAAPVPLPVTSTNPYGNQPAVLPSSYNAVPAASHAPLDPALTATTPSVKTETGYDFAAPIDPALQSLPTPATIPSTQNQPFAADHRAGFDNHLRATNMRVDDLIGLLGPAAPTQEIALTPELLAEIVNIYHEVYASGLQAFFETAWFSTKDAQGKYPMEHSQAILSQFASFVKVLQAVPANDHTQMAHSGVLESRLIWALASLPRNSASVTSSAALTEAAGRVQVVDTLLTGDFLSANPLVAPTNEPNPHRRQELEFWYNLAEYLRYHDPVKRDEILGRLRLQLGGRENRDLIYSIAISREISPRVEPGFERTIPQHLDESDPKNRLYVANKFIREEAQVTGGTTNIVRRFSEIAIRSFISPGVNIARPAPAAPAPAQP